MREIEDGQRSLNEIDRRAPPMVPLPTDRAREQRACSTSIQVLALVFRFGATRRRAAGRWFA
jgi:hypothetical protein